MDAQYCVLFILDSCGINLAVGVYNCLEYFDTIAGPAKTVVHPSSTLELNAVQGFCSLCSGNVQEKVKCRDELVVWMHSISICMLIAIYLRRATLSTIGPSLIFLNIAIVSKWLMPRNGSSLSASISSPVNKHNCPSKWLLLEFNVIVLLMQKSVYGSEQVQPCPANITHTNKNKASNEFQKPTYQQVSCHYRRLGLSRKPFSRICPDCLEANHVHRQC